MFYLSFPDVIVWVGGDLGKGSGVVDRRRYEVSPRLLSWARNSGNCVKSCLSLFLNHKINTSQMCLVNSLEIYRVTHQVVCKLSIQGLCNIHKGPEPRLWDQPDVSPCRAVVKCLPRSFNRSSIILRRPSPILIASELSARLLTPCSMRTWQSRVTLQGSTVKNLERIFLF